MAKPTSYVDKSFVERTRVPLSASGEPAARLRQDPKRYKVLPFAMEHQCHTNWCWAALAVSIAAFYDSSSAFTQCAVANLELGRSDCCDAPCGTDNVPFNVIHEPGAALNRVDCLDLEIRNEVGSWEKIKEEIENERPVCVRTIWTKGDSAGGAHALAITGYCDASKTLALEDPWFGTTHEISYDRFRTDYQGLGGRWTD